MWDAKLSIELYTGKKQAAANTAKTIISEVGVDSTIIGPIAALIQAGMYNSATNVVNQIEWFANDNRDVTLKIKRESLIVLFFYFVSVRDVSRADKYYQELHKMYMDFASNPDQIKDLRSYEELLSMLRNGTISSYDNGSEPITVQTVIDNPVLLFDAPVFSRHAEKMNVESTPIEWPHPPKLGFRLAAKSILLSSDGHNAESFYESAALDNRVNPKIPWIALGHYYLHVDSGAHNRHKVYNAYSNAVVRMSENGIRSYVQHVLLLDKELSKECACSVAKTFEKHLLYIANDEKYIGVDSVHALVLLAIMDVKCSSDVVVSQIIAIYDQICARQSYSGFNEFHARSQSIISHLEAGGYQTEARSVEALLNRKTSQIRN
jgi:hypothetical protein